MVKTKEDLIKEGKITAPTATVTKEYGPNVQNGAQKITETIQDTVKQPTGQNVALPENQYIYGGATYNPGQSSVISPVQPLKVEPSPTANTSNWIQKKSIEDQAKAKVAEEEAAKQVAEQNKAIYEQGQILAQVKGKQEYATKQRELAAQNDQQNFMAQQAVGAQRIEEAQQNFNNMQQKIAYLGSLGSLGQSSVKVQAVQKQLNDAAVTLNRVRSLVQGSDESARRNLEAQQNQFDYQMKQLQDYLDSSVDKVIQDAAKERDSLATVGNIDSLGELNDLRLKILNSVDRNVEGILNKDIANRQMLIDNYNKLIDDQEKYITNKNTVNKDMSTAQGYYVDGNGEPIISSSTGKTIPVPKDAPLDPIFDKKTGQLISFSLDENGKIISTVDQVIDQPTFSQSTIASAVQAVANGTITAAQALEILPPQAQQDFLAQLGSVQKRKEPNDWKYNSETNMYERTGVDGGLETQPVPNTSEPITGKVASDYVKQGNVEGLAQVMDYGVEYDCIDSNGRGGQCGEWFNDTIGTANGTRVGDSYASKQSKISPDITVGSPGMGVVFNIDNISGENGHVGVLASGPYEMNGKIGYDVISANAHGNNKLSKDFVTEDLIASSGGGFIPVKTGVTQQPGESVEDLKQTAQYIIDTQPRGQGFSESDVKAFTDAVNKYAKAGDSDTVYQLLRNRILDNKNVGDYVYDNAELKRGLDVVEQLLNAYKTSGGSTNVFTSIAEKVANYNGTTTSKELAKVKNQLGVLVADYIRAISGTAASDKEVQRLLANIPNIKNVEGFNTAILEQLRSNANNKMQARIETALGFKKDLGPKIFPEAYDSTGNNNTDIINQGNNAADDLVNKYTNGQ